MNPTPFTIYRVPLPTTGNEYKGNKLLFTDYAGGFSDVLPAEIVISLLLPSSIFSSRSHPHYIPIIIPGAELTLVSLYLYLYEDLLPSGALLHGFFTSHERISMDFNIDIINTPLPFRFPPLGGL